MTEVSLSGSKRSGTSSRRRTANLCSKVAKVFRMVSKPPSIVPKEWSQVGAAAGIGCTFTSDCLSPLGLHSRRHSHEEDSYLLTKTIEKR